ncbi:MAG: hypothetical protein ACRD2L_20505, partial [Terriglobia bacterium]
GWTRWSGRTSSMHQNRSAIESLLKLGRVGLDARGRRDRLGRSLQREVGDNEGDNNDPSNETI